MVNEKEIEDVYIDLIYLKKKIECSIICFFVKGWCVCFCIYFVVIIIKI